MCAYQKTRLKFFARNFSDTNVSILRKVGRIIFGALVLVAMVLVWYQIEQYWVIICLVPQRL